MPILAVAGLEKYYGANMILSGVTLQVEAQQKLALAGRNGCGKTTLLRIIAGLEEIDRGAVQIEQGIKIRFLAQDFVPDNPDRSVWREMFDLFADLTRIEREMERLSEAMAAGGPGLEPMIGHYAQLQEEYEHREGYTIKTRIERVLRGLGLDEKSWGKPIKVLSGGERTRVALARLLLYQPDLILLDEPTNHLDLWAVAWLEDYLNRYPGAVLVVSHDRYFLDRVVRGVYEMAAGKVRFYHGNYTIYRAAREEERRVLEHAAKIQEREIARKERLVRESTADERSKRQARSIAKSIGRMERVEHLPEESPALKLKLKSGERSGRIALTVQGLTKAFAGRPVIRDAEFRIETGEKVGIIGPNGSGKTTLLKMLLGLANPDRGSIKFGHNIRTDYFAQEDPLPEQGTVFAYMKEAGAGDDFETRSHLARFLFRGEDVWKQVASLSGGECRRLSLARLTLSSANFLLLDEPTNHLDLQSIEALEESVSAFSGSVLAVSHDRYFLGRVTDRILAINDGAIMPFSGYLAYAAWHEAQQAREAEARAREAAARREAQHKEREARRAPVREEKRRVRMLQRMEALLLAREDEKSSLTEQMSRPEVATDFLALHELSTRLAKLEEEIAGLYAEWEALADES